ncbi:MAG: CBS domain-containing protein [Actinomycetota bacterium]
MSEVMFTKLTTCDPEATIGEAATLMGERRIGSVLICDDQRLVGIVTERDVVRALSAAHDAPQRPVAEWMTKGPTTIGPDADVQQALRTMVDGGFRHLPVTEGERVVGMLSIRDVAGAIAG